MLALMADKKVILNLRLRPETRDQFALAAELRGASMSGLIHQFIVRTIREEKEASPAEFIKLAESPQLIEVRDNLVANISSGIPSKDAEIEKRNREASQLATTEQLEMIKDRVTPRRSTQVGVLKQKTR